MQPVPRVTHLLLTRDLVKDAGCHTKRTTQATDEANIRTDILQHGLRGITSQYT